MNLWAIFLTGLTTGGLSCLALQGGLLASSISNQKKRELVTQVSHKKTQTFDQLDWLPVALFLTTKLIAHTALGFLLGWVGSQVELSLSMRLLFQGGAALFMLATAANLLNLHPIFRYVVIQPPKFVQKMVRSSSKGSALFTPALLGALTIFIPCGVTQAMEVLAITSGSPVLGAAILFTFVLGTSPLFLLLGVATARLSETLQKQFLTVAAILLIFLSAGSLNGILVVLDSPVTFEKITKPIFYFFSDERFAGKNTSKAIVADGVQRATIAVTNYGYSPNKLIVKAGTPVELTLETNETYSCASSFILKAFDIRLQLGPTDSKTVSFLPTKKGSYTFSCSMGMYSGVLEVR